MWLGLFVPPPPPPIIEKSESILLYFAEDRMDFELLNFNINLPVETQIYPFSQLPKTEL